MWKRDRNFGAPPARACSLKCEFPGTFVAEAVPIRQANTARLSAPPGNFQGWGRYFSRAPAAQSVIKVRWIESMRGATSERKTGRPDLRIRCRTGWRIGRRDAGNRWRKPQALTDFTSGFFLFYLTTGVIFDNRHGLLKKFESAQAAKTLSAVEPRS